MLVAQRAPGELVLQGASMTVPLEEVFVSISLDEDVAHIGCDGADGIHPKELSRTDGELVVRLGAHAQIRLPENASDNGDLSTAVDSEGGLS